MAAAMVTVIAAMAAATPTDTAAMGTADTATDMATGARATAAAAPRLWPVMASPVMAVTVTGGSGGARASFRSGGPGPAGRPCGGRKTGRGGPGALLYCRG